MQHVLIARNLKKKYKNGVQAVKGIDLAIHKGEVFGFLGPNGAGKSTTMDMLTGLSLPSSGSIEKRDLILGYVPQEIVFYDHLTCLENMKLFASCYELTEKTRIEFLLELFELEDLKNRRSGMMSGGQKRRLNLAIGLLQNPDILFLDEPSAGMDPQSRNILWTVIEKISKDITIVLSTHLMEVADRLSDRIAIIDKGEISVIDTPSNLKKQYGSGDLLEITLKNCGGLLSLPLSQEQYKINGNIIQISTLNAISIIPELIEYITKELGEGCIAGMTLRENTLEDVFITLTGSQLREVSL